MIFVTGFERGKEDLLPLPLKEDSHSISKSKVRKISTEMFSDGSDGMVRCNETREYAPLLSFSQSRLGNEISYTGMTHKSWNTIQIKHLNVLHPF